MRMSILFRYTNINWFLKPHMVANLFDTDDKGAARRPVPQPRVSVAPQLPPPEMEKSRKRLRGW